MEEVACVANLSSLLFTVLVPQSEEMCVLQGRDSLKYSCKCSFLEVGRVYYLPKQPHDRLLGRTWTGSLMYSLDDQSCMPTNLENSAWMPRVPYELT